MNVNEDEYLTNTRTLNVTWGETQHDTLSDKKVPYYSELSGLVQRGSNGHSFFFTAIKPKAIRPWYLSESVLL